jgi:hypothetical protein
MAASNTLDQVQPAACVLEVNAATPDALLLLLPLPLLWCALQGGTLANCWLIAAVSAVAEYSATLGNEDIESVFIDRTYIPGRTCILFSITSTPAFQARCFDRQPDKTVLQSGAPVGLTMELMHVLHITSPTLQSSRGCGLLVSLNVLHPISTPAFCRRINNL